MKKIVGFIIFIALISIFACNKDTDEVTNDTFTQAGVESWFNNSFKKSEEWQQNSDSPKKAPDWSNGMSLKEKNIEVFEFPLMENKATITVPQDKSITDRETTKILGGTLSRLVIIKTSTREILVRKLYYVPSYEYLLSKGYDISDVMIGKAKDDFTGLLITKKWNDEVLSYHNVKNGKIEEILVKHDINDHEGISLNSIKMNNYTASKTRRLSDEQNLEEVIIDNNYHEPIIYVNLPSQPYYPSTNPSYDPYGTSSGGGTNSGTSTLSISQTIVKNIDYTKLDPCPKEVYEKLKNATNSDIAAMLKKLGANSVYKVTIKMGQTNTYAGTQRISNYNYLINVSPDTYTDGTKLFKATSILHEVIHAYFLSIIDDYANNSNSDLVRSFPQLFEIYVKNKYPSSSDKKDVQHKEMANKYVDAMASVLQEYDENGAVSYQTYKDMAWASLIDTPIFDATFPAGSVESKRIKNRYGAESSGRAVDQGTASEQFPVGKKCN